MKQQGNFLLLERNEFKDWLDKQKVTRKITTLQVHHTYSPNYTTRKNQYPFKCLEGMRNSHLANGWSGTGQQFTTLENGLIAVSLDRDMNTPPAGIKGVNSNGICIEHVGNFDIGGDTITDEQKKTVVYMYACLADKFNLPIDTDHIVYHGWFTKTGERLIDYTPGKSSKTCPGTAFFGDGNTINAANKTFIPMIKQEYVNLHKQKVAEKVMKQFSKYFNDIEKEWQAGAIDDCVDRGLLAVPKDKKFNPDASISRAEVAIIMSRLVSKILDGSLK